MKKFSKPQPQRNLYLLKRKDKKGWDQAVGFVIRAESPEKARQIAAKNCGDEGPGTWLGWRLTSIRTVATDVKGPASVVLLSYRAG